MSNKKLKKQEGLKFSTQTLENISFVKTTS